MDYTPRLAESNARGAGVAKRLVLPFIVLLGKTALAGTALAGAAPPAPSAPCVACVALTVPAGEADAAIAEGTRVSGVDVLITGGSDETATALALAGARVWTMAEATGEMVHASVGLTGVFIRVPPAVDRARAEYLLKSSASALRGARPELRLGLVLSPVWLDPAGARAIAPYVDEVYIPADLAARELPPAYRTLVRWYARPAGDLLDANAGLSEAIAAIDATGRFRALAPLASMLRDWMPPGLTPLADLQVTCDGCRVDAWLHPDTLDAIVVVREAEGRIIGLAPGAARVSALSIAEGAPAVSLEIEAAAPGVRVELPPVPLPVVLRVEGWRGVDESIFRTGVEVTAARALTLEEILARHHAQRARQAALVSSVVSTGTTVLTFEVPGFAGPVTVAADTTIFQRGALTEVAQQHITVNGVAMDSDGGVPRLPIIEPERVATPPLAISLTDAYAYRLSGRAREDGRSCYVIAFTPRVKGPSFSGRAWIDAASFAIVRLETAETGLRGAIVSAEQHDTFAPVDVAGREVWLPLRSRSFQIYQAAGLRTPIHREVITPAHIVNAVDFEARLEQVRASRAVMLRDTPEGYRYLVPAPLPQAMASAAQSPAPRRVISEAAGTRVATLAFGVLVDPNISVPLPFAGLSYVDFDFLRTGGQFSGFFGGSFGQAAWTLPGVPRPGWQVTGRAFGIGVSYNDRAFRNGREQYAQNIRQRPLRADLSVVAPLAARVQLRLGYEFEYTAFERGDDTAPDFLVPADAVVHGARVALDLQRGPWSALAWWNPATRQGWRRWGDSTTDYRPGTSDFQRYGMTLARSWVLTSGTVARVEGSWLGGHDLDRFSRYSFDSFENRLRGYPSALVRFDRGGVARSVVTWTPMPFARLDAFADTAFVHDPGAGRGLRNYPGVGVALEVPLPRRLLLAVEWGYGIKARDSDGGEGTHVVKVTGFKVF